MSRRGIGRRPNEDRPEAPPVEPSVDNQEAADADQGAPEAPPVEPSVDTPARKPAPGRVLCRAIKTVLYEGMPRFAGEQFSMLKEHAEKHEDRGQVEIL